MATKLLGKKIDGKRLGFIALAFSVLFCVSSLKVYRGEKAESEELKLARHTVESLQGEWHRDAEDLLIVYFSGHGAVPAKFRGSRFTKVTIGFDHTMSILAHEFAHAVKDDKRSTITLTFAHADALAIEAQFSNSPADYFYERLLLEKRRQEGHLSQSSYEKELLQMSRTYAAKLSISEVTSHEESLRGKLDAAEQQLSLMQAQVISLKEHLARAERTTSEKWFPVITAILSLLVALSANVIAWRADRRQVREAELIALKRQDLEKNIIQKDQQIKESNGRIIAPSAQEIRIYSQAVPVGNLERDKRSRTQYR